MVKINLTLFMLVAYLPYLCHTFMFLLSLVELATLLLSLIEFQLKLNYNVNYNYCLHLCQK